MVRQPTIICEWEWACPVHLVFGGNLQISFDRELPNKDCYRIIMDDILIFSTQKTHKQDIEDLLDVLIQYGLQISPHKCQMF